MMVRMTTDTHVPVVRAERTPCATPCSTSAPTPRPCATRGAPATSPPTSSLRERRPDLASGIWFAPLEGRMERGQAAMAAGDYPALVEKVRSGPPWWSPMHLARVDALVNTAELVIHHEDALRGDGAVGPRREVPERTARGRPGGAAHVGLADVPPRAGRGAARRPRRGADHGRAGARRSSR